MWPSVNMGCRVLSFRTIWCFFIIFDVNFRISFHSKSLKAHAFVKMPENTNVTNSIDGITPEQTVSIDLGKRSLEEPEVDNDERKKFKTNEDVNNDQPTLSKRQIKKIQKQQYWLDQKAKRK